MMRLVLSVGSFFLLCSTLTGQLQVSWKAWTPAAVFAEQNSNAGMAKADATVDLKASNLDVQVEIPRTGPRARASTSLTLSRSVHATIREEALLTGSTRAPISASVGTHGATLTLKSSRPVLVRLEIVVDVTQLRLSDPGGVSYAAEVNLGTLTTGKKDSLRLEFEIVGKNPRAEPGYMLGLDYVKLVRKAR